MPWVLLEPLTLIASGLPLPATQAAPPLLRFQVQLPFVFWPGKAQEGRGGAGRGRGLWGRGEEETRRAPGEPLSRSQPQLRVLALVKHKKMRAVTRHGEAAQPAHPAARPVLEHGGEADDERQRGQPVHSEDTARGRRQTQLALDPPALLSPHTSRAGSLVSKQA